jgi:hypothetical protein
MRAKAYFVNLVMLAGLIANTAVAAPLIIGILEERLSGDWGSPLQNSMRIGFVKAGLEWAALHCQNPKDISNAACHEVARPESSVTWTIYYHGKALGKVKTTAWLIPTSSNKDSLVIAPGRVPTVGAPSKDFAGWMDTAVHRPLIAVNSTVPPFANRWSRDTTHPELVAEAWPAFRTVVSAVDVCTKDSGVASHYTLRSSDIKPMTGWRSTSGELLLHFGIDPRLQENCNIQDNQDVWLFRGLDGNFRALPGQVWSADESINFTPSLELIDAGDFDGDGGEEAVFFFSGYNFDGYVLHHDNFRKAVRFGWHYH